ncbi:MAG: nucleotidyltransferase family protein [Nitrospirales bacterium]|nr:nucleotidyltransferase family protein [Nitrospirales bacterium]
MTALSFKQNGLATSKNQPSSLGCTTAAVLAGGVGSRLRPVIHDRSKVMAPVHGVPFLAYLLEQISQYGIQSVVLCTGVFADSIVSFFGSHYQGLTIHYSYESEPRGTAGALREAMELFDSYPVLVMNGDSFCDVNLERFVQWHIEKRGVVSLALARVEQGDRFGAVQFDADSRLTEFSEKGRKAGPIWANAGIYLMERSFIEAIPRGEPSSLEREIFPQMLSGGIHGYPSEGRFLDIGTPASYRVAEEFFADPHSNRKIRSLGGTPVGSL